MINTIELLVYNTKVKLTLKKSDILIYGMSAEKFKLIISNLTTSNNTLNRLDFKLDKWNDIINYFSNMNNNSKVSLLTKLPSTLDIGKNNTANILI